MFPTQLHAILDGLGHSRSTEHANIITPGCARKKVLLLLARVSNAASAFKPSAHADSNQDLLARSHPWRLPRVFVPFAGSQHHEAPVRTHAVHAVLSRRGGTRAQGFKLQCRRVRAMQEHAVHHDPPWMYFDGALHRLEATCGVVNGDSDFEEEGRASRAKALLTRT